MILPSTPTRRLANRVAICAVFLTLAVSGWRVSAAGCRLEHLSPATVSFAGGQPGQLAQFSWWAAGPVGRYYHGGQLVYFQLASHGATDDSGPCDSPGCRGSEPQPRMLGEVSSERLRQASDLVAARVSMFGFEAAQRRVPLDYQRLAPRPFLDGPFRPPA